MKKAARNARTRSTAHAQHDEKNKTRNRNDGNDRPRQKRKRKRHHLRDDCRTPPPALSRGQRPALWPHRHHFIRVLNGSRDVFCFCWLRSVTGRQRALAAIIDVPCRLTEFPSNAGVGPSSISRGRFEIGLTQLLLVLCFFQSRKRRNRGADTFDVALHLSAFHLLTPRPTTESRLQTTVRLTRETNSVTT